MKSQWIPFLAITAAVINAAVIGLLNDPRVDVLNGPASALCLTIAFMRSDNAKSEATPAQLAR